MYQRRVFYRHARYVHGWLSAFAFLVLIFFALTGLFLNNPDWFKSSTQEQTNQVIITQDVLEKIRQQENPATDLLDYIRQKQSIVGRYRSSEVLDDEVMIRLESPAGTTDISVLLDTGDAEITRKPAGLVSVLNDLHRGKNVGTSWHWLIDISAILILLLSVAGYILFLSIKTRLVTHLLLTAASLAVLILLVWVAV